MLATSTFSSTAPTFLPLIPSPLSPRRSNISSSGGSSSSNAHYQTQNQHSSPIQQQQTGFTFSMTSPTTTDSHSHSSSSNEHLNQQPFSARQIKTPPRSTTSQQQLLTRRRALFLSKVQKNREARRWDDRIEDLAQSDWRREKRVWEGGLAEEAARLYPSTLSEDEAVDVEDRGQEEIEAEAEEAEEILRREREELDALVEMMEGQSLPRDMEQEQEFQEQEQQRGMDSNRSCESGFGSEDDEEYDSLFMALIERGEGLMQGGQQQPAGAGPQAHLPMHAGDQDEEMDLS